MRPSLLAALLLAAALLPAPAPAGEGGDDPFTLSVNPLRKGTEGWERTSGGEKAFVWTADDATLSFKVPSGKDSPRVVNRSLQWETFEARFRIRKGTKKLRLVLQPAPAGNPVLLEIPSSAASRAAWNEATLRVGVGKAALSIPEGAGEKEVAAAKIPAGARVRFGFEAPPGAEGAVAEVALVQRYEDGPQAREEGFESVFDGKDLGAWRAMRPEMAAVFRAENGFLVGEPRAEEDGGLVLGDRRLKAYELRFRALWASSHLEVRALEVPGEAGRINPFESVHVNLTDNLDPENWNEVVVRLADGGCTMQVNGKKVAEQKVKPGVGPTFVSLFVVKGKRFFLRDLRIKDLAPGEGDAGGGGPHGEPPPGPEAKPEAPAAVPWKASGGFEEKAEGWEVAEAAAAGAGLLCTAGQASSYRVRFKVAKGARGLSLVPRANRGLERSPGIRVGDATFEGVEWTEVVLEMDLLTAVVRIGGQEVGRLESESAVGAPALRVSGGGHARIKDLAFEPVRGKR